jgi:hypothetical protein
MMLFLNMYSSVEREIATFALFRFFGLIFSWRSVKTGFCDCDDARSNRRALSQGLLVPRTMFSDVLFAGPLAKKPRP